MTTYEPPPEARLIARLRQEKVPLLSMREAARRAGISAALWTQNEQGHRKVTPAVKIPIRATDDKLALMALVVGATPDQLRETGRESAAKTLQKLIDAGPDPAAQLAEAVRHSDGLTEKQKRALIEMVLRDADSTGEHALALCYLCDVNQLKMPRVYPLHTFTKFVDLERTVWTTPYGPDCCAR